jgi:succinate dehydrogenase / fumarate reductase cytochrome b subunit
MNSTPQRPLSPHLTIWKWGWHMAISILHRVTGGALTVVGLAVLVFWLASIAGGEIAYGRFQKIADHWAGIVVLLGLTLAFWQHLFSGLRHLVLDTGAGYELRTNRFWSVMTVVGSITATSLTWAILTGYLPALISGGGL